MIVSSSVIGPVITESTVDAKYRRIDLDELMAQTDAKLIAAYDTNCGVLHGPTGRDHVVALAHRGSKSDYILDLVALPCPPHCSDKGTKPYDESELVLMSTYITELLTEPVEGYTRP